MTRSPENSDSEALKLAIEQQKSEAPLSSIEFENPGKKIEYIQTEMGQMIAGDMNKLRIDGATKDELLTFNEIANDHLISVSRETDKFRQKVVKITKGASD
jgi:hypothetical protein